MKKTLNINLNGIVFNIDEDAFNMLSEYLDNLRHIFERNGDDADEIINDIEGRICELLSEKISNERSRNHQPYRRNYLSYGTPRRVWRV